MANKNKNVSIGELPKTLFDFSIFKRDVTTHSLLLYNAFLVLIIAGINLMRNLSSYSSQEAISAFVLALLGTPFILFLIYGLLYLFVNAFENSKKGFFDGYLVFLTVTLPFLLIGHLLNWIRTTYLELFTILGFILILVLFYFIFNMVRHMTVFFETTWIRVLVSFILVDLVFIIATVAQYLVELVMSLR